MNNIQNLLTHVGTINRKNDEILQATGGKFNMFSLLKVDHYENIHSKIIAELLDPNGTHGLNNIFLQLFLEETTKTSPFDNFEASNCFVRTEANVIDGRIDILIEDYNDRAIIIENKIYASDQLKQLIRYDNFANVKYKEYQIFYLTLLGKSASNESAGEIDYKIISYKNHIIPWLDKCVHTASRFPLVRETLIQYINHLKKITGQDTNMKNSQEIADLLSLPHNFEAAIKINENLDLTKNKILEDLIEKLSTEFNLEGILSNDYTCIIFKKKEWKNRAGIWFAFDRNKTYYSIKTENALLGKAQPQNQANELFTKKPDKWNPYGYGYVSDEHWSSNPYIYLSILDGSFSNNVIKPNLDKVLKFLSRNPEIENLL